MGIFNDFDKRDQKLLSIIKKSLFSGDEETIQVVEDVEEILEKGVKSFFDPTGSAEISLLARLTMLVLHAMENGEENEILKDLFSGLAEMGEMIVTVVEVVEEFGPGAIIAIVEQIGEELFFELLDQDISHINLPSDELSVDVNNIKEILSDKSQYEDLKEQSMQKISERINSQPELGKKIRQSGNEIGG